MMDIKLIKEKMKGRKPGVIGDRRQYAVLIPLVERDDGVHLLFSFVQTGEFFIDKSRNFLLNFKRR